MNYLDIGIIILIVFCALVGFRKGLIRTVYGLISFFIALFLANYLYPHVAGFLRATPLFGGIQNQVKTSLNLSEVVVEHTANRQEEIINSLPLPEPFLKLLNENFQPDIHGILRVDTIEDYISGFFASIAINGIAIVLVFLAVIIILAVAGSVLDIVGKLPVIRTFNNWGGFAFGVLLGSGISWVIIVAMSTFLATNPDVFELLDNSFIVGRFFESILEQLVLS